jgi:hypothetical protein
MDRAKAKIVLELGALQCGKYIDLQILMSIRKVNSQMAFNDGPDQKVPRSMSACSTRRYTKLGIL